MSHASPKLHSQLIIAKKPLAMVIASLMSGRIWFQVDPRDHDGTTTISVKAEEAELLKRVVHLANEMESE